MSIWARADICKLRGGYQNFIINNMYVFQQWTSTSMIVTADDYSQENTFCTNLFKQDIKKILKLKRSKRNNHHVCYTGHGDIEGGTQNTKV